MICDKVGDLFKVDRVTVVIVLQNKRRLMTFYMPKLVLVGSLWLLVVSLSFWQEYQQLRDPTYDYQFDTGYAMVC